MDDTSKKIQKEMDTLRNDISEQLKSQTTPEIRREIFEQLRPLREQISDINQQVTFRVMEQMINGVDSEILKKVQSQIIEQISTQIADEFMKQNKDKINHIINNAIEQNMQNNSKS